MVKDSISSRGAQLVRFLQTVMHYFDDDGNGESSCIDLYEFNQLMNILNRLDENDTLTVDCSSLTFKVCLSNMDPSPKLKGKYLFVILSLKYDWQKGGDIRETKTEEEKKDTNMSIYDCNIQVKGYEEEKGIRRLFAWHLDCEETTVGKFIHPHFHFHAGGKKLSGLDTGSLLMISSPRIAYPPMDLPLAVHFIIRNFVHRDDMAHQYKILEDKSYKWIVNQSVKYILKPYFKKVYENVDSPFFHYFPSGL